MIGMTLMLGVLFSAPPWFPSLPDEPSFVLGNGGLTVAFDTSGNLFSCRWPGPGGPEQTDERVPLVKTRVLAGAHWQVLGDDAWPGDSVYGNSRWPTVVTTYRSAHGATVTRVALVDPQTDVLILHYSGTAVPGFAELQHEICAWPNSLPPAPLALRLTRLGQRARPAPAMLLEENVITQYSAWGDTQASMSVSARSTSDMRISASRDDAQPSAVITLRSGKFETYEEWSCTLVLAWAETREQSAALSRNAAPGTFYEWMTRSGQLGHELMELGESGGVSGVHATQRQDFFRLFAASDRGSGMVVFSPREDALFGAPPLNAWAAEAFAMLGFQDRAWKMLEAWLPRIRAIAPTGAIPAALARGNGEIAAPESVVVLEGAAGMLLALDALAEMEPAKAREELSPDWETTIVALGETLAAWSDGPGGAPAPAFDFSCMHDTSTIGQHLSIQAGLAAGVRLLGRLNEEVPEHWTLRIQALDTLARFAVLNQVDPWNLDPPLVHGLRRTFDGDHPVWRARVRHGSETMSLGDLSPVLGYQDDTSAYGAAIRIVARAAGTNLATVP